MQELWGVHSYSLNISDIVNWKSESERGSVFAYFIYRTLCDMIKTHGLN
jgi:hypothetical protein